MNKNSFAGGLSFSHLKSHGVTASGLRTLDLFNMGMNYCVLRI